MILPTGAKDFEEAMQMGTETYHGALQRTWKSLGEKLTRECLYSPQERHQGQVRSGW